MNEMHLVPESGTPVSIPQEYGNMGYLSIYILYKIARAFFAQVVVHIQTLSCFVLQLFPFVCFFR